MNFVSLKKAWALLDAQERHTSLKVLAVMVIGAFASPPQDLRGMSLSAGRWQELRRDGFD
jgi:hypothetical protein